MHIHQHTAVYWTDLSSRKLELESRSSHSRQLFPFLNFSFGHRTPFWNILHWGKGKTKNCFGWRTGLGRDWSPTCLTSFLPGRPLRGSHWRWAFEALLTPDSEHERHGHCWLQGGESPEDRRDSQRASEGAGAPRPVSPAPHLLADARVSRLQRRGSEAGTFKGVKV